jgi:hypothetical protein
MAMLAESMFPRLPIFARIRGGVYLGSEPAAAAAAVKIRFAADSALEEAGFELTVPPERKAFRRGLDRFHRPSVTRRQAWPHRASLAPSGDPRQERSQEGFPL